MDGIITSMEEISFYFQHWNSDVISLGVLINVILIISGYFYGKLFQKFAQGLKKVDATFLGIFFMLAIFQIYTYFSVCLKVNTVYAYYLVAGLILLSPILCLIFWVNVLPTWKNLFGLLVGILVSYVLCVASSKLNTNNIFFDSVTYLSEVTENISSETFGYCIYVQGWHYTNVEPLHDFTGYYYFWSMLIRWARDLFDLKETLVPIYIWGGTVFYGMAIGNLIVSSANLLYDKFFQWKGVLLGLLILSPYYSNYFNTTLAFFGNSVRSIVIGWAVLIAYTIIKGKDKRENALFPLLTISYYAAICMSSSSFFIVAMITAGLFFTMAFQKETNYKTWIWFILSCTPIFHYALHVVGPFVSQYFIVIGIVAAILIFLIIIAILLRKKMLYFCRFGQILLPIVIIGFIAVSFLKRNSEFGYDFYFAIRSINDMTVNYTNYINQDEKIRNIILYVLIALLIPNYKNESQFKLFLLIVGALFLNPLVQPAVSNYLTSHVYTRSFDIIVNPFTMIFMLYNIEKLFPKKLRFINYALTFVVLPIAGYFSYKMAYTLLTVPYSQTLIPFQEDYNWKTKTTADSEEMFEYIQHEIVDKHEFDPTLEDINDNFPMFISQDVSLKAYVSGIQVHFTAVNYRDALENAKPGTRDYDFITIFYPDRRYGGDGTMEGADYSKLQDICLESEADYLLMNNTMAIWNERGWYDKTYAQILFDGVVTKVHENTNWILFKINKDWQPKVEEPVMEEPTEEPAEEPEP